MYIHVTYTYIPSVGCRGSARDLHVESRLGSPRRGRSPPAQCALALQGLWWGFLCLPVVAVAAAHSSACEGNESVFIMEDYSLQNEYVNRYIYIRGCIYTYSDPTP